MVLLKNKVALVEKLAKGRTPKAPTNPMSLSEMKAKFTVAKQSGIDGTE